MKKKKNISNIFKYLITKKKKSNNNTNIEKIFLTIAIECYICKLFQSLIINYDDYFPGRGRIIGYCIQ